MGQTSRSEETGGDQVTSQRLVLNEVDGSDYAPEKRPLSKSAAFRLAGHRHKPHR